MKLVLFFSRGVSLELWLNKGLFDREKLLYERHLEEGNLKKVYWLTYGTKDLLLANQLIKDKLLHENIRVLQMPKIFDIPKVGSYLYSLILPFYYRKELKKSDILKTNQTDGSWSAVMTKKLYNKKLIYRTGFTISQLENNLKRFNIIIRKSIEFFERLAYKNSDKAVVSSKHNLDYVLEKYKIYQKDIEIIYNFIDRDKFYNFNEIRENKVVFVGRLSVEKNIFNLIEALQNVYLPLEIYGSGPLRKELDIFISQNSFNVKFMGNVSNSELPMILNKSKYYALVSEHEGMPKALIEAMACGSICIGTNVSGINEVIIDNTTGILADDTSSEAIDIAFKKAIELSNIDVEELKYNMHHHINHYFILDNIVKKEKNIFEELLK